MQLACAASRTALASNSIRKREQPSLPVETPAGDWKTRQNIPKNLLWLFVINLEIAYCAGLYEQRIIIPQWFSKDIERRVRVLMRRSFWSSHSHLVSSQRSPPGGPRLTASEIILQHRKTLDQIRPADFAQNRRHHDVRDCEVVTRKIRPGRQLVLQSRRAEKAKA